MTKNENSCMVGISLGSKTSLVSFLGTSLQNRPQIIGNQDGDRATPTCVSFQNDQILVGTQAKQQAARGNPKNTIQDFLHLVGLKSTEHESVVSYPSDNIWFDEKKDSLCLALYGCERESVSVTELLVYLLEHLRENAESFLGQSISGGVVLTVPMSFTLEQMQVVEEAAIAAKLKVLQIISESAASLLAYQQSQSDSMSKLLAPRVSDCGKSWILLIDYGGHSLDLSLMSIDVGDGLFRTVAAKSLTQVGGHAIDNLLAQIFIAEFQRKTGFEKREVLATRKSWNKLMAAAERTKIMLSQTSNAPCFVESLFEGVDFKSNLNRIKFDSIIQPVMENCRLAIHEFLSDLAPAKDSSFSAQSSLDHVIFLGGASKIPAFQAMVKRSIPSHTVLHAELDAEETACLGAGIQAFILDAFNVSLPLKDHLPGHLNPSQ